MKELEPHSNMPTTHKIELTVKKKKEIECELQGEITPKKGQKIFEINEGDGSVSEAKYRNTTTVYNYSQKRQHEKLIIKPGCVYIPAMNADNAKKKYSKNKSQASYFKKPPVLFLH